MAVEPSGSLSLAEEAAADLLANLGAVQSFLGVGTAEAAKAKLYNDAVATDAVRPYGLYYLDPEGAPGFEMESIAPYQWDQRGIIRVVLERAVPEAYESNVKSAEMDLKNHIGAILDDMREAAGNSGYLNVMRAQVFGPWRFDQDWEETLLGKIQAFGLALYWES